MNIIEAIKEFQTGKYEYMTHPKSSSKYFVKGDQIVSQHTEYVYFSLIEFLESWEMGPKKKERKTGWINIYRHGVTGEAYIYGCPPYPTKEEAIEVQCEPVIDTIEIAWYE